MIFYCDNVALSVQKRETEDETSLKIKISTTEGFIVIDEDRAS